MPNASAKAVSSRFIVLYVLYSAKNVILRRLSLNFSGFGFGLFRLGGFAFDVG